MNRTLSKSEFMPLVQNAFADLTDYSVGFIKASSKDPSQAILVGSGTLVSAGGFKAILTAHHVLTCLPDSGRIGLLTPMRFGPQIHHLTIDMEHVQKIPIAKGQIDSQGPDLGLLVFAPADWMRLPSGKIFYNLPMRREAMMNNPPEENSGAWVVCGMVGERTADLSSKDEQQYGKGKSFSGICINTAPCGKRQDQEFDYRSVQIERNPSYEGPVSFGGCSGGGLWQLLVRENPDGALEIFESVLAGVAFYETEDGIKQTIECHGPRSIYGKITDELEALQKLADGEK